MRQYPATTSAGPLRLIKVGLVIMAIGIAPILLYSLFGPADGNPIGLGVLMVVAVPIGFLVFGSGLLRLLIARLQDPT